MTDHERISHLCNQLQLSPYQSYILANNSKKYDLGRLVKRDGILYAPYAHDDKGSVSEYFSRIIHGPRADLIGSDGMIVNNSRGIRIHRGGFYTGDKTGTSR